MDDAEHELPIEVLEQIDQLCNRFEVEWKAGALPSIESALPLIAAEFRDWLLIELVRTEIECRRSAGESASLLDYSDRFSVFKNASHKIDDDRKTLRWSLGGPLVEPSHMGATDLQPIGGSVTLTVIDGPHQGERHVFQQHDTLMVGRAADAQWRLIKDPYFSRYHFRIEANPPACLLVDLQSRSGTFVNGRLAQQALLSDGDIISGGDTRIRVNVQLSPQPLPTSSDDPETIERLAAAAARDTDVLPKFAAYEVLKELGRGAMGVVYHARHRGSRKELAIKMIHPQTAAGLQAVDHFLREVSILTQLRHPRIVECREVGQIEGAMYLTMEYIPTVDLRQLLASQSQRSAVRLACGIACRVLEALQHAHENDVVHRDVKPSNILVYRKHSEKVRISAKLADFGLAKNYLYAGFTALSSEQQVKGTLAFMAPEQLINCRFAKPSCDIYATGACLYYFLTGRTPHDHSPGVNDMAKILNGPVVPIAQRDPTIATDLAHVVDRALAREPGDRFSSASHMRNELEKFASKR
jgi:hypothetical protein